MESHLTSANLSVGSIWNGMSHIRKLHPTGSFDSKEYEECRNKKDVGLKCHAKLNPTGIWCVFDCAKEFFPRDMS
jgi:hypothetical protein